jgi:hypothetical protein
MMDDILKDIDCPATCAGMLHPEVILPTAPSNPREGYDLILAGPVGDLLGRDVRFPAGGAFIQ